MNIFFNKKEEFLEQSKKDGIYKFHYREIMILRKYKNFENILKESSLGFKIWCIKNGYIQFLDYIDFEKLSGYDIITILIDLPELAYKCDFGKLAGYDWVKLLNEHSELSKSFYINENVYKIDGQNLNKLFKLIPDLIEKIDWNKLNEIQLYQLIMTRKDLIDRCDCSKIKNYHLFRLLLEHPDLVKYFNLNNLNSYYLKELFEYHPNLI